MGRPRKDDIETCRTCSHDDCIGVEDERCPLHQKEKVREYHRQYYRRNREKIKKRKRARYHRIKESQIEAECQA